MVNEVLIEKVLKTSTPLGFLSLKDEILKGLGYDLKKSKVRKEKSKEGDE